MNISNIKTDCRQFKGDIPCRAHKSFGAHCIDSNGKPCEYYDPVDENILIIKLGAIGDVIRTTPLFTRLKKEHPRAKFFWMTNTSSVIPDAVDITLNFNAQSVVYLTSIQFDIAINLDKDKEACALFDQIDSKIKYGFTLKNGLPAPVNNFAEHKFATGIFDDINKANTKNYLEEIFEICNLKYKDEKYLLDSFENYKRDWDLDRTKKIIGLNTGCGGRWTSRLWSEEYWIELASQLIGSGFEVVLLGGELEREKNLRLSQKTGAKYFGHFPLQTFINLVSNVDLVVTAVTMAMHITLALEKKIVLFNNIFNSNEFELFGLGEIIKPEKECKCFFTQQCENSEYNCMDYLHPQKVFELINKLLSQ